jgi:hypothetical protein
MRTYKFAQVFLLVLLSPAVFAETIILTEAPFKSQSPPGDWNKNMNCGPASALMLGSYYMSQEPTADHLQSVLDWLYDWDYFEPQVNAEYYDGNVTNVYELRDIMQNYFGIPKIEIKAHKDVDYLRRQINKLNPVIVGVNIKMDPSKLGHFMVVVGFTDSSIIVHDPGRTEGQFNAYDLEIFLASWQTSNYTSLVVPRSPATWFPSGTLIQPIGSDIKYQVIGEQVFEILNEIVFNALDFNKEQVIPVRDETLSCYEYGGKLDWVPDRQLFEVDDTYYLREKTSAEAETCTVYTFASIASLNSWNLNAQAQFITDMELLEDCSQGYDLYLRAGSLIKPGFQLPGFGSGVVFVAEEHGVLRPFADWPAFYLLGYDTQPLQIVSEGEFHKSFTSFGEMIYASDSEICLTCAIENQGAIDLDDVDQDGDGFSVYQNDCDDLNPDIFPGQEEICDELDNNCDGEEDENLTQFCHTGCSPGERYCEDGIWSDCNPFEIVLEIEDGIDNDCDGLIDEGFTIPEDMDPLDADNDNDGFSINQGDCDNWEPTVYPGAPEICDGLDNDCDLATEKDSACGINTAVEVDCIVSCPENYIAFVWFGSSGQVSGQPAQLQTSVEEICLRGQPWFDFNCAIEQPLWQDFDWTLAQVECNHDYTVTAGQIDSHGEGEVWFHDFSCSD